MDVDPPKPLWTPELALRSKAQVLLEDFNSKNQDEALFKRRKCSGDPAPTDTKTWTTLTLPYQAPSSPPIPSMDEIRAATKHERLSANNCGHLVCKLGDVVIKYSFHENIVEEAENLLYLAEKRPKLHIPRVLAVWSVKEEGKSVQYCLMMNFIEGIALTQAKFAKLPVHVQDTICAKVSSQVRYLRELPSEGYYGRVHGQGLLYTPMGINLTTTEFKVSGPYKTYEDFVSAICRAKQVQDAMATNRLEWHPAEVEIDARLRSIFPDWSPNEPKLTWVDPKMDNIIAQKIIREDGSEDWDVFLVDWECTGWYPAWVQALQFDHRSVVWLHDYTKKPTRNDGYPMFLYRDPEIKHMMTMDFDPNPDRERFSIIEKADWGFF